MNDISNHNLRPATARVSVVPSKPADSQSSAVQDKGGKILPPATQKAATNDQSVKQNKQVAKTVVANKEMIEAAVAKMNEYTQSIQRDLRFNLDESSGRTVVSVVDRESKEVIRQIPDEVFLKLARNIKHHMELNFGNQLVESDGNALNLINTSA